MLELMLRPKFLNKYFNYTLCILVLPLVFILASCDFKEKNKNVLFGTLQASEKAQPIIILKMDDLEYTERAFVSNWERYIDTIKSYQINSGLGIIIDQLSSSPQSFKDSLITWHKRDDFEIWHHGWDHLRLNCPPDSVNDGEFKGTSYAYQKSHLDKGMQVVKDELGITMRSFGAPYNKTDETFHKVISENLDLKVWLYCEDPTYSGECLVRGLTNQLESNTGIVSFQSFLEAYSTNSNPYLVLQGHPGKWDNKSFEEFHEVIRFLKERNHDFMLPFDYHLSKQH